MRRVLQLLGLSGLLVTGFGSTHAFAQEPANAEPEQPPTEEQKTEPWAPVAPAPAVAAPAATPVAPAAKPKVGDISTHGYLRGGWGGSVSQKGRATCFGLASINGSLKSKYRLGNECEQWGEFLLSSVVYAGDDGSVASFHFRPVAFIPTSLDGYSPSMTTSSQSQSGLGSTGATVAFPDLYADISRSSLSMSRGRLCDCTTRSRRSSRCARTCSPTRTSTATPSTDSCARCWYRLANST